MHLCEDILLNGDDNLVANQSWDGISQILD
jgi:hypothetical protein